MSSNLQENETKWGQKPRLFFTSEHPTEQPKQFRQTEQRRTCLRRSTLLRLSVQQQNAIDLLVKVVQTGRLDERGSVTRSTLTRWRLHHSAFRAELNVQRSSGRFREKLRALIPGTGGVLGDSMRVTQPTQTGPTSAWTFCERSTF